MLFYTSRVNQNNLCEYLKFKGFYELCYITDKQETNEKCKIRCHPTIKMKRACYNIIFTENVVVIYYFNF